MSDRPNVVRPYGSGPEIGEQDPVRARRLRLGKGRWAEQEKAMDLNTYLGFDGNCAAAFKFYEKVLGGKILMTMSYGDMPGCSEMSADVKAKIAHARMQLGDKLLMGSDAPHGRYEK